MGTGESRPPWRLLLVEDAAIDAELIADELERAGIGFELHRVEDETAYRAALDEQRPDAILADWSLPHFSGRAALKIARESQPEVPFIFVAGTMPFATAREMLRHGAVDYVFKNQLVMLPLVLTRAMEEAARRGEVLHRLQRTEAQLRIAQLADGLSEQELLTAGLDLIEQLTGSRMAFLHFVNDDQESLELLAWSTRTRKCCEIMGLEHNSISGAGIWAESVRLQRPTIVNGYAARPEMKAVPEGHLHLERLLCVPTIADGRAQAVLGVANKAADYDSFDVETLQLLGGHLWRIVQRARSEQALRDTVARLREANAQTQAAEMSALGQLAAGIAHELNAPLAYAKSNLVSLGAYIDKLRAMFDADHGGADVQAVERREAFAFIKADAQPAIAQTLEGIDRARRFIVDLEGFARRGDAQEWQSADLNRELDVAVDLVWKELKQKCVVHKAYGELPPVRCLPNRLSKVFVNLLCNAGQAIADKGEITLRTAHVDGEVRIEVTDTGTGIAPENLRRVFEPFYTTKPKGVGSGLGLAVSAGIVAQHRGRIEVESDVGRGTTFRLRLPVEPTAVLASESAA